MLYIFKTLIKTNYMKWDIQAVNFTMKPELMDYSKEKVEGLNKFYNRIVGAEIYLKLGQQADSNKVVEIKLNIPGNDLFAESHSPKFEGAINDAVDKLKGQLRKLKTKMETLH